MIQADTERGGVYIEGRMIKEKGNEKERQADIERERDGTFIRTKFHEHNIMLSLEIN